MKIAVIKGDGIGPEVVDEAVKVLNAISKKYECNFEYKEVLMGGAAIDKVGEPLPKETIEVCKNSDAVLLGAVGGPKWDNVPRNLRPEAGLLKIRKELQVFANLRPAIMFPQMKDASPLKEGILGDSLDLMIVRELTGGIYFGDKDRIDIEQGQKAWDIMSYSTPEIARIAKVAFKIADKRNKHITLVDKANVLENSRLWREVVSAISKEHEDIKIDYMYVDNAAMQLIRNPKQFDVILTGNMFGDILSDEASMLTGSLGMLPSASIGKNKIGLYEPIHGSAPDIAGEDKANPIATIMSIAMMLRFSFDMEEAAKDIENAVSKILEKGYRTLDIMEEGMIKVGTQKMGELISQNIK
ncbi:3-isopropylmalate dehydrogenase [Clostridium aestuarii]|uniref:3-isopropylmalate dehydrogenase n=1 Tax=Clostridium aestuarii TaxID=338193 RepID=A0ABT4D3U7_9CLOT|nr:3-isopropylmalate dehydrogenase [Clostridium aestuarii]MCY6485925.1 3-isopropylmalate dehydrogenase [Clostridium aestuarii]